MYLSLIQRIILGFAIVTLFVFALGASSYFSQSKMASQLELTGATLTELLDQSNVLVQHLQDANRTMLVHANTRSEQQRSNLRQRFEQAGLSYEQTLGTLTQNLQDYPGLLNRLQALQGQAVTLLNEEVAHQDLHDQRVQARALSAQELISFEEEWLFFQQDMADLLSETQDAGLQQVAWDIEFVMNQGRGAESYLQKVLAADSDEKAKVIEAELKLYLERFKEKTERIIKAYPDGEEYVTVYVELLERAVISPEGLLQRHLEYIRLNDNSRELLSRIAEELEAVLNDSNVLVSEIRTLSRQAVQQAKGESEQVLTLNMFLVLVSVLVALVVAATVVRTVRAPLEAIIATLTRLEQGDLTRRINIDFRSELGKVALHVNKLSDQLSELIAKVQQSAHTLSDVAGESHNMSSKTSSDVALQQQQTDSIATAVTEMEHAVHEVASHAVETSSEVDAVVSLAEGNMHNMQQNREFVRELQQSLTRATDVISQLSGESEQIGEILTVIQSISEQTNLLALNAAIEAARAGEHGRGFAVVADEVRSLATRTQESADEINGMILSLQQKSRQAVEIVESNLSQAEQSVEQTDQTHDSLQDMVRKLSMINDMSRSIATASEQQSAVAKEVAQNIVGISDMATSIARDSEEVASNSDALNRLSTEQSELVSQFKL